MTNPLVAIEQITYLLFLNQLEKMDKERVRQGKPSIYEGTTEYDKIINESDEKTDGGGKIKTKVTVKSEISYETCRWSYIVKDPSYNHIQDVVFPWLRQIDYILYPPSDDPEAEPPPRYLEDASFQLDRNKQAMLKDSISIINDLFGSASSANADLMGDIFEYLLNEIQTSGKNGQFRTPRHIIRFMIELLNPGRNEPIMDPAAGTAGYLINSVLHLKKKATDKETMRLEWDGSPHRLVGDNDPHNIMDSLTGEFFEGYDNDRTMVRIAWMNMVLHGIERPRIFRGDSLSKHFRPLLDNKKYKNILANPPFTGTVDQDDLSEVLKSKGTNKSELLFVWLILELLDLDGRAAVVVPEGVLFGSTNAHKELRRTLLAENFVDAIISLPAGVFQPYTGVKTSIILFRKRDGLPTDNQPQTPLVWFYEIEADGYSLDAKREPQPWAENDIWDCLLKYHDLNKPEEDFDYYQPRIYEERWREIDDKFFDIFPELDERLGSEKGKERSISERFGNLPDAPDQARQRIIAAQQPNITGLFVNFVTLTLLDEKTDVLAGTNTVNQKRQKAESYFKKQLRPLEKHFRDASNDLLEKQAKGITPYGLEALNQCLNVGRKTVFDLSVAMLEADKIETVTKAFNVQAVLGGKQTEDYWQRQVTAIVREFAKLDGYDVQLLDATIKPQRVPPPGPEEGEKARETSLIESKCWAAPVRVWAQDDDWEHKDEDGAVLLKGSHNEDGNVRPEYVNAHMKDGVPIDTDLLEPDCIEANDYNLSAGRYKPFKLQPVSYDPPADIIRVLQKMEGNIQAGLANLLTKIEGAE